MAEIGKNPIVDVEMILKLPTDELNDLMQKIKHQTRVKEEEKKCGQRLLNILDWLENVLKLA